MKLFNRGKGFRVARISGTGNKYGNREQYCLHDPTTGAQTTAIVGVAEVFGETVVHTESGSVYSTGPALSVGDGIKIYTLGVPTTKI